MVDFREIKGELFILAKWNMGGVQYEKMIRAYFTYQLVWIPMREKGFLFPGYTTTVWAGITTSSIVQPVQVWYLSFHNMLGFAGFYASILRNYWLLELSDVDEENKYFCKGTLFIIIVDFDNWPWTSHW